MARVFEYVTFALLMSLSLLACVPVVQTSDGRMLRATDAEFRAYAASVFRRQNAISVAIADAMDANALSGPDASASLASAESKMLDACEEVNALAIARRDGADIPTSILRNTAASVATCEAAAMRAETALTIYGP